MKKRFINEVKNLQSILSSKPKEPKVSVKLHEYGYGKIDFHRKGIETGTEKVRAAAFELGCLYRDDLKNRDIIVKILQITLDDFREKLTDLLDLAGQLKEKPRPERLKIQIPEKIPPSIRPHVFSDLRELEKSFNSECFRAATILCGRVLETCLHRKYYDATGLDILEKNPGIGLGKLIAKLAEKKVSFDPGLTQQIHLINQVRIHSVHVKKESFYPSQQQTYAMILYTMDVLEKMF